MAIGMTPLIPLDRVIADPAARFERFGINNNQLFGKPMVTFGGLTTLPAETRTAWATPKAEAAPTPPSPGAEPSPLVKWAENPGTGAPSSPGALVDVQA
jgi:hypothetical protein